MLKDILSFYDIPVPVDLTVLAAGAVIASIIPHWQKRNEAIKRAAIPMICLGLLTFWVFANSFWSPSISYKFTKLAQYCLLIVAFMAPLVKDGLRWKRFYWIFYGGTVLIAIWYLQKYTMYLGTEKFYEFAGLGLSSGLVLGLLIVQLTSDMYPFRTMPKSLRWLSVFVLAVIIFLMGARGPLLFSVIASAANYGLRFLQGGKVEFRFKPKAIGAIAVAGLVFVLSFQLLNTRSPESFNRIFNRSIHRLELLVGSNSNSVSGSSDHGKSVDTRLKQIEFSVDAVLSHPTQLLVGFGFGSYSFYESGVDGRGYPHNIILELLFEIGLIGLVLFILFICSAVYGGLNNPGRVVVFSTLFYLLLNLLKSSSIVDSRYLFAWLALLLVGSFFESHSDHSDERIDEA